MLCYLVKIQLLGYERLLFFSFYNCSYKINHFQNVPISNHLSIKLYYLIES